MHQLPLFFVSLEVRDSDPDYRNVYVRVLGWNHVEVGSRKVADLRLRGRRRNRYKDVDYGWIKVHEKAC